MGSYLAINPGTVGEEIPGETTTDPAFGLPAVWIGEEQRERAEQLGFTVVDPPSIIATHLTEIIKRHASEILGREEVKSILDTLKQDYPTVVDEAQKALSVGEIQKILQGLLSEQVSVRNMAVILETVADYAGVSKDPGYLVEKVRQALGRQISLQHADAARTLRVLTLSPDLEQSIIDARMETATGAQAALDPQAHRRLVNTMANAVKQVQDQGLAAVLLTSEAARPLVRSAVVRELPQLVVISVPEVSKETQVEPLGEVRLD